VSSGWHGFVARPLGMALIRTAMLVVFLVGWEWASGNVIPKFWISSPSAIAAALGRWIADYSLFGHVAATLT
jgi:NitT/TauT family transport system permease protein